MKFHVIYSIDIPRDERIKRYHPPNLSAWTLMAGDDGYEYSYLEGRWEHGKHRTYVRDDMDERELTRFLDECSLYSQSTPTLGALVEGELRPAVAFTSDGETSDGDVFIQSAYITPEPEQGDDLDGPAAMEWLVERFAPGWCIITCERCRKLITVEERAGQARYKGRAYWRSIVCADCYSRARVHKVPYGG